MNENKVEFRKKLMAIALPVALQNLMLALVGASDALMLGRLSQNAVSAVSLANQISFIMSLFSGAVLGGAGTLIAQYYGKNDRTTVKNLMSVSIRLGELIAVIFFIAAFFFPKNLMRIYTSEDELIRIGAQYLRIVSWSYLMNGISQSYLLVMKICGRAARSAMISTLTVLIDMSVDAFLIYGLAGFPKMGVAGCAISTVVVETCAMIVCLAESYRGDHIHPDRKSLMYHSKALTQDLSKVSFPMLASSLTWGIGYSMNFMIMGRLGTDAIAAASVISVIQELVTCFSLPLGFLGLLIFHWPVLVIYICIMTDEIVKIPWIYPRYKKYIWLRNLTREEM
jgi:Na+-driven multidrug efflux pump